MIVVKSWRKVERPKTVRLGDAYRCVHIYRGWFLLGVVPVFIVRETTWYSM